MNRFFIDSLKMMRENYIRAFGGKYDTEMCPIKDVEVDERETAVRECLPGNNCGACGYSGAGWK